MKSPLYKKFQQLNVALTESNFRSAEILLRDLHEENLTTTASVLFDSLYRRFVLASGVAIEFESPVILPEIEPERPDGLLSSYVERPLLDGFSLVSCCMNRNDNLKKSLESWLRLPVQEIVIVDWSSSIPVADTIADIADERVKVIRVENETNWILTYAFNVGLRFASYKKIFKLDADIETRENFLDLNHFETGEFIRGSWESAVREGCDDQVYINGSYGCFKSDLVKISFYNEHIRTYGWDDSDLYTRLSTICGLKQKYLAFNSLSHIHQEQEERLKYQAITKSLFLNRVPATEFTNSCNKFTIALFDQWWPAFLQDYMISHAGDNVWSCQRTTEHRLIPDSVCRDARKYAVLENLFRANSMWAERAYSAPWMAEFIYEQYIAEFPFSETAAVLLLEESANGYFAKGTSPYNVLKAAVKRQTDRQSTHIQHLYVFEGNNTRIELLFSGQQFVVHGLDTSRFQSVKKAHSDSGLQEVFLTSELPDSPLEFGDDAELERVLAISLYDESNQERMDEYLESLQRNLQYFDVVAIFYEQSSGEMYKKANEVIAACEPACKANVIWINIHDRPTFEEIFNTVDFILPNTIVVTTNADIVFDESIYEINAVLDQDSFLVLSRQEVPECTDGKGGYIMSHFGLPNVWSADAWVYQTPRKMDFKASFPVGTFHCDSFLNYFIGKSRYRVYNPCLSINTFHIHHEDFNSSEFKRLALAEEIAETLRREIDYCDGEAPIRGIQWCRIKDVLNHERADQLITWSNFIINIFVDAEGRNLVSSLAIAVMCLKISRHVEGKISVSLNIPAETADTVLGDLLFDALQAFGNRDLSIAITNPGEQRPFVKGPDTCYKASVDIKSLVQTYLASFPGNDATALFETDINFVELDGQRAISFTPHMSIYFAENEADDLTTYLLLKMLKNEEFDLIARVISVLGQGRGALQPYIDEIAVARSRRGNFSAPQLLNELWGSGLQQKKTAFEITFITSIFRGADFFKGFLENIAASAIECNAEVILVDAASPDNEREIFSSFIAEYPGLENRFKYIPLEDDPGLYNCWKLAIERSSSSLISNANLDDRRSPYHTAALLNLIRNKSELSGAATAIRAMKAKNSGWYSVTDNDYWFTDESSNAIEFKSLFSANENEEVYSRNMMHCMPVWKKSLHEEYGYFNEDRYGTSADWAFWLECTKGGEVFELLPAILSMYFISETSHNRANDVEGEKELVIIRDYFDIDQKDFIQQ